MIKKIKFIQLLDDVDRYDIATRFEVFRWMLTSGWSYRDRSGVFEWLYGTHTINGQSYPGDHGFFSGDKLDYGLELKLIFLRAIISETQDHNVSKWREDQNIFISSSRFLNLNLDKEPRDNSTHKLLYKLFSAPSDIKTLKVQLNEYHPKAIQISQTRIYPTQKEWFAVLDYGYDGSGWSHFLAKQGDSSFNKFLETAAKELERIT